jgi:hypothetical protein
MKNWMRYLIGIGASVASAGLLYGLVLSIICKGVASSEAAGWAQAIGAVATIAVAIWIPYEQKRGASIVERRTFLERSVVLAGRLRGITAEASIFAGRGVRLNADEIARRRNGILKISPSIDSDLLSRMAQLEADEIIPIRSTCIFDLRDAMSKLSIALADNAAKQSALTFDERDHVRELREKIEGIDQVARIFQMEADKALKAEFPNALSWSSDSPA